RAPPSHPPFGRARVETAWEEAVVELRQAFPIAIIDEDYEGKHAAGRGMRQLAQAIEKQGFRVVSGLSYKDARRLVNVANNESCWLVSVDGSEDVATRWEI